MSDETSNTQDGWAEFGYGGRHYFIDDRPLCGQYGGHVGPGNCGACEIRLRAIAKDVPSEVSGYKDARDVPTEVLAKRLEELSDAVVRGKESIDREFFYMRVPAEPDHDADIVLDEAARRLREMESRAIDAGPVVIGTDTEYDFLSAHLSATEALLRYAEKFDDTVGIMQFRYRAWELRQRLEVLRRTAQEARE